MVLMVMGIFLCFVIRIIGKFVFRFVIWCNRFMLFEFFSLILVIMYLGKFGVSWVRVWVVVEYLIGLNFVSFIYCVNVVCMDGLLLMIMIGMFWFLFIILLFLCLGGVVD